MKKKEAVSSIIFIIIGIVIAYLLSLMLRYKESYHFKNLFYSSKDDYDVLFFGASHPHCAVDPNILWDEFGITSYNLASSGEPITLSLFAIESALENNHPKLIVVDSGKITDDIGHDHVHIGEVHKTLDAIPLSRTKVEAAFYLLRTDVIKEPLELFSGIYTYHDRIYDLSRYDFEVGSTLGRGKDWNVSIRKKQMPVIDRETRADINRGDGVKAYEKIVNLCREKGVPLIFTAMPSTAGYYKNHIALYNALADYTEEQGFEVMDMDSDASEMGIDYDYDFGGGSHLNIMGAGKVSRYLGKKLLGTHGIEDKRGTPGYESWDRIRNDYVDEVLQYLRYQSEATSFLMMAGDSRLESRIYVRDENLTGSIYGLEYELSYLKIKPETAGDDVLGEGNDMLVLVYDRRNEGADLPAIRKTFKFNEREQILTVTGEEAETVNYFPEADE